MLHVSNAELARRRRVGLDRWDEMWEGVLHMVPAPAYEHQRILDELVEFLGPLVRRSGRGILRSGINVFNDAAAEENYRIPDLTFVAQRREHIIAKDGIRGGGPDAVIEIGSPEDETYEKLPFFARLGVREVLVIDRDTKSPEVYLLAGQQYVAVQADSEGWLASTTLGVRFRQIDGQSPRLVVEDRIDPSRRIEI